MAAARGEVGFWPRPNEKKQGKVFGRDGGSMEMLGVKLSG